MKTKPLLEINATNLINAIERGYGGLDSARAAGLEGLLRIREIKTRQLKRDLETAKKLDKDSIGPLETALEANARLNGMLQREAIVAKTEIPERKEGAAIVHGYVWQNESGKPVPCSGVRVSVFSSNGREKGKNLASRKTDQQGYFQIEIKIAAFKRAGSHKLGTTESPNDGLIAVVGADGKNVSAFKSVPLMANSLSFREFVLDKNFRSQKTYRKKTRPK